MRIQLFLFWILVSSTALAFPQQSLLKELDNKIKNRQHYANLKEIRIDSLKKTAIYLQTDQEFYQLNSLIIQEYATYNFDSTMSYIIRNRNIAERLKASPLLLDNQLDYASLLSTTGLINEAIDVMKSIDRSMVTDEQLLKYYETAEWTYHRARAFSNDTIFAPMYYEKTRLYIDSVYMYLPANSLEHTSYKGFILMLDNKWDEAEKVLLEFSNKLDPSTRLYAIVTHYMATIYKEKNNIQKFEYYIIKSAISDQLCALKENSALQTLAIHLYQNYPKEIKRAYNYLRVSLEDAKFFNNRIRAVQIGYKLPIVVSAYEEKSKKENTKLKLSLALTSILILLLITSLLFIFNQIKILNQRKNELKKLNKKLNTLNASLAHANKTKEEYISLFINLCSSYIDQLDSYRKTVKNKILAKQIEDLLKQSKSSEKMDSLLQEFFYNFDKAFLKLYPNFIRDLNTLLKDEEQIVLKNDELLSVELRIFALIRLGIDDSAQIATFLRYSPQTIYNYRSKIRKKAKDEFRDDLDKIVIQIDI